MREHIQHRWPTDFDPAEYPILSQHWFEIEPAYPINQIAADAISNLRRRRQIQHVYGLGHRAVQELVCDVAGGADLDHALAAYTRLTPGLLRAVGGDRFPPTPIREVS